MHVLKKVNSCTISLAFMSLVRLILENGAMCWDPYSEGQINALDRVPKKVAKFANHMSDLVWETLVQHSSNMCPVQSIHWRTGLAIYMEQVEGPCYLSRDYHDHKIRARKQRTDIVKYCFVKRTNCGNNFACKSHIFRKRVRKVI
jgi:hypothetical protein